MTVQNLGACLESSMAEWWHKRRVHFRSISRISALRVEARPRDKFMATMMATEGGIRTIMLQPHGIGDEPAFFHHTPLV